MHTALPDPLPLAWELKPLSSARVGVDTLDDGRRKFWVQHDVLRDITPSMLAWWFGHMDGDVEIGGRRFPRYRVWHPLDHVYAHYTRRAPDGSIGPGAQIGLCEYLVRNPRYRIEAVTTIEKLDETGFIHSVIRAGVELARMEHVFTKTAGGTRDENCLIVPGSARLGPLTTLLLPFMLPADKGEAWLKHSVEEIGTLERFLPALYVHEAKCESGTEQAAVV